MFFESFVLRAAGHRPTVAATHRNSLRSRLLAAAGPGPFGLQAPRGNGASHDVWSSCGSCDTRKLVSMLHNAGLPTDVLGRAGARATQVGCDFRIDLRRSVLCPSSADLAHLLGGPSLHRDCGSDRSLSRTRLVFVVAVCCGVARVVVSRVPLASFHLSHGCETPPERLRAFLLHGYHHEFPDDPMRLVAPPLMSWPIGVAIALILYALIGPPSWLPMFAGMSAGYLAYDWIHYYTHHFHPRRGIGKWLRSYHMLHHFQDRESRFGVSSPLWDLVFGTYKPVPHVDASPLQTRSQSSMRLSNGRTCPVDRDWVVY